MSVLWQTIEQYDVEKLRQTLKMLKIKPAHSTKEELLQQLKSELYEITETDSDSSIGTLISNCLVFTAKTHQISTEQIYQMDEENASKYLSGELEKTSSNTLIDSTKNKLLECQSKYTEQLNSEEKQELEYKIKDNASASSLLKTLTYHSIQNGNIIQLLRIYNSSGVISTFTLMGLFPIALINPLFIIPIILLGFRMYLRGSKDQRFTFFMMTVIEDFWYIMEKYRQPEYVEYFKELNEDLAETNQLIEDIQLYLEHKDMPLDEARKKEWYQNVQNHMRKIENLVE